ncbi:MAG TPA: hypothetical protein VJV78_05740, partial [Polyangiales bacterium]|nr:hypothetical protein [Polyangiales bacterium]
SGNSVLERNNHPSRSGLFVHASLTKAMASKMALDTNFKATFNGAMWASPLYIENGPGGKGAFFSVTTGNDVFALDETTGAQLWMHHLGDSPTANGVSCGNIHPLGILSTPVIDAGSRTIYVAGAIGTNSIARHEVHALSIEDGMSRSGWPFDVTKVKSGSQAFMPPPHNQRSALSLVNGTLYVAYGGHVGDCGDYRGWVVGIDTKDPTKFGGWASRGRGEGIWAAGGMASDGNGVFAITGNSTNGASSRDSSDSEQVVRVTGLGVLERNNKNLYFPTSWRNMDSVDADFGASSPIYISVSGATPENYVVAISKDGHFYLLDAANLGGEAGHKVDFSIATGSMAIRTVPAAYPGSSGVNVVFSTSSGAKCPMGMPSGKVVMAVQVPPGSPPAPKVLWCAAQSGENTSPIVTTTDGHSEPIVWFVNNGKLTAVDGDTGAVLWNGGSDNCSNVRRWTSPIAVKGRIVAGGDGHLCSWSVH